MQLRPTMCTCLCYKVYVPVKYASEGLDLREKN